jgi:chromosome segregation ATPase
MPKMPEPRTSNGHATGGKEWVKGTPPDCPDIAREYGGSDTPEPLSKEETTAEIVSGTISEAVNPKDEHVSVDSPTGTCERCTQLEAQVETLRSRMHTTVKAIAAACEECRVDTEALRHENALLRAKVVPLQAVIDAYPKSPKQQLVQQTIDLQAEKAVALQDVARLKDRVEELEGILCTRDDRIEELEQEHAAKDERIRLLEALLRQNNIEVPA